MKIKLDIDELTFGDMEDFEEFAGVPLMEAMQQVQAGQMPLKPAIGLIWICQRAINPNFTLDDARKVKLNDLEIDLEDDEPDPTPGSA